MAGAQLRFYQFDSSKKSDWLGADFDTAMYFFMALAALEVFAAPVLARGCAVINLDVVATWLADARMNLLWGLVINAIGAFYVVFVQRWNPRVNETRQFRYICRWL